MKQLTELTVQITEDEAGLEDIDSSCRKLREHLLTLDVETVKLLGPRSALDRDAIDETKGGDFVAIAGMLLVTFSQSPELIGMIVDILRTWVSGHPKRKVRIVIGQDSLELEDQPLSEQRRIVDQFLNRHE